MHKVPTGTCNDCHLAPTALQRNGSSKFCEETLGGADNPRQGGTPCWPVKGAGQNGYGNVTDYHDRRRLRVNCSDVFSNRILPVAASEMIEWNGRWYTS